ncbi:MAG: NHL repeat-containing protein [Thermomicrobiales bacterium]
MDHSSFDHLTRAVAALRTRRAAATAFATGLAALPLLGGALLPDDAAAKRQRHRRQHASHTAAAEKKKKKKKATYCVNGQTTQVTLTKKSKKRLKQQGATPGACAPSGCQPACAPGSICCGGACKIGTFVNQTTFAANGSGATTIDGPYGVAITSDTRAVWIADYFNNRVSVWTRPDASGVNWSNQTTFGSGPASGASNFRYPTGVAVAADGLTVWIADSQNHRVAVWSRPNPGGSWTAGPAIAGPTSGSSLTKLDSPQGVAITADGMTAIVADSFNHRVSVWMRASVGGPWGNQQVFGSHGSTMDKMIYPYGVAVTPDGLQVAVADANNNRIAIWTRATATGTFTAQTTFGGGPPSADANRFNQPRKVTFSSDARTAYIADPQNSRVSIWSRTTASSTDWQNQTIIGAGVGTGPANLTAPQDVAVSPDGQTLVIADTTNDRISVWSMTCPA